MCLCVRASERERAAREIRRGATSCGGGAGWDDEKSSLSSMLSSHSMGFRFFGLVFGFCVRFGLVFLFAFIASWERAEEGATGTRES